jgi:hypothetical protein
VRSSEISANVIPHITATARSRMWELGCVCVCGGGGGGGGGGEGFACLIPLSQSR